MVILRYISCKYFSYHSINPEIAHAHVCINFELADQEASLNLFCRSQGYLGSYHRWIGGYHCRSGCSENAVQPHVAVGNCSSTSPLFHLFRPSRPSKQPRYFSNSLINHVKNAIWRCLLDHDKKRSRDTTR